MNEVVNGTCFKVFEIIWFPFSSNSAAFKIENTFCLTVLRYFARQIGTFQFATFPIRLAMSGNCPTKNKIQCIAEADVSNPANMKV